MSKVTSLVKQVSGLTPEVSKKVAAMVGAVVGDAASIHLRKSKLFREIELYSRISRGFSLLEILKCIQFPNII